MFRKIVHCDWSKSPEKWLLSVAELSDQNFLVHVTSLVGDTKTMNVFDRSYLNCFSIHCHEPY